MMKKYLLLLLFLISAKSNSFAQNPFFNVQKIMEVNQVIGQIIE
jgi:hypothetical protein